MQDKQYVYILKNDYSPDGSRIYGVYSTREKAKKAKERYESDDNEYGESCDTLDIDVCELE
jgi:hypothetical protein